MTRVNIKVVWSINFYTKDCVLSLNKSSYMMLVRGGVLQKLNSAFCPHCVFVCRMILKINSDYLLKQH
jgi:hypothetical protein